MLTALSVHSKISMSVHVKGDLHVDCHHTLSRTPESLSRSCSRRLLPVQSGIVRRRNSLHSCYQSLAMATLTQHKSFLVFNCDFTSHAAAMTFGMTEEFFRAFAFNSGMTLHINLLYGRKHDTTRKLRLYTRRSQTTLKTAVSFNSDGSMLQPKESGDDSYHSTMVQAIFSVLRMLLTISDSALV